MVQARLSDNVHAELKKLIKKKNKNYDRKNVTISEVINDLIIANKSRR
jgi:hypothetical protein